MEIRAEIPDDIASVRAVTAAAFENVPFSDQTEPAIVDALRRAGALSVSLVATEDGDVVGHVAFSPVLINRQAGDWYGLGPVSVRPDRQRQGVGQRLIRQGLEELRSRGAEGCVVFGEPAYYGRFGFVGDPDLRFAGAPPGYFQRLALKSTPPRGEVTYHAAFGAT
jgi:putative acetyltransferase